LVVMSTARSCSCDSANAKDGLEDEVRRVYEWLEAALAGGQGGDPANGFDD